MATAYGILLQPAQAELRANIRQMAKDRGWKLADLAREAQVGYSPLTQGLGANRWFTEDDVDDLADAFKVSSGELLGASVFKDAARGSIFDKPHPRHVGEDVGTGHGRALCCECGTFRRYTVAEPVRGGKNVWDGSDDPLGRRMIVTLRCRTCEKDTTHAELRRGEHRDHAEEVDRAPTREQESIAKRDALIARLAEFNVDVHLRPRPEPRRSEGWATRYEYDESKSQWRIEVDPHLPARLQVDELQSAWRSIATGEHGKIDWDPREGVLLMPSEGMWERAADDLIKDICRALPMERQRLRLDVVDEITRPGKSIVR